MFDGILIFIGEYWLTIVIWLVALVGGFFIFHYCTGRKKLCIYQKTEKIFSEEDTHQVYSKLDILYEEEPVKKLYKSEVIVWNNGNKEMEKDAITGTCSFALKAVDTGVIFQVYNLILSDTDCKAFIKQVENGVIEVHSNYLNCKEGLRFDVLHTEPLEVIKLSVSSDKVKNVRYLPLSCTVDLPSRVVLRFCSFFLFILLLNLLQSFIQKPPRVNSIILLCFTLISLSYIVLVDFLPRPPKKLVSVKTKTKTKKKNSR